MRVKRIQFEHPGKLGRSRCFNWLCFFPLNSVVLGAFNSWIGRRLVRELERDTTLKYFSPRT